MVISLSIAYRCSLCVQRMVSHSEQNGILFSVYFPRGFHSEHNTCMGNSSLWSQYIVRFFSFIHMCFNIFCGDHLVPWLYFWFHWEWRSMVSSWIIPCNLWVTEIPGKNHFVHAEILVQRLLGPFHRTEPKPQLLCIPILNNLKQSFACV